MSHGTLQMDSVSYPLRVPGPTGKKVTGLYKKRLDNFLTPGQWERVNLLS